MECLACRTPQETERGVIGTQEAIDAQENGKRVDRVRGAKRGKTESIITKRRSELLENHVQFVKLLCDRAIFTSNVTLRTIED